MAWPDSKKQHQATGKIHIVDFGKSGPKRSKLFEKLFLGGILDIMRSGKLSQIKQLESDFMRSYVAEGEVGQW